MHVWIQEHVIFLSEWCWWLRAWQKHEKFTRTESGCSYQLQGSYSKRFFIHAITCKLNWFSQYVRSFLPLNRRIRNKKIFYQKFPINFQLMTNSNSRLSDQLFNWPIPDLLTAWMPSIVYILRFVWHYNEEKGMKNVAEEKSLPKRRRVLRH